MRTFIPFARSQSFSQVVEDPGLGRTGSKVVQFGEGCIEADLPLGIIPTHYYIASLFCLNEICTQEGRLTRIT